VWATSGGKLKNNWTDEGLSCDRRSLMRIRNKGLTSLAKKVKYIEKGVVEREN